MAGTGVAQTGGVAGSRGILIVASEPLLLMGLTKAVEQSQRCKSLGLVLHGAVDSAREAQKHLGAMRAALVLLVLDPPLRDVTLSGACSLLIEAQPMAKVLVLLRQPDRASVRLACRHGARAVYETAISVEELEACIETVFSGNVTIQPSLVQYLLDGGNGEDEPGNSHSQLLTERELVALQFLARGYTSKEIASMVGTTAKAVDLTIERATRRLGASHRAQAVAIAIQRRLIT